ncbi:tripartite tricarboxylate transporter TctB family protein [Gallaecimonas xiamenensis]|uniref:DUF1468 domain-containing protein n=1 Tax=Gallaecimonas xiamenensis 3-C-1 TaxID=745411 RepID=K2JQF2_9GAMM|nr:tripartite tricarboxylate transporter TctB family protein [Gallaecimonas xiamenensis]EKE76752.1 hypothetical protein B3C1_04125 [Gallaecimonas xiamenensis 3-C-1]
MTQSKRRSLSLNGDVVLGLIFLVAALVFLVKLVPDFIEQPGYMQHPLLSPRFLPSVMGWIVLVLSLGLVLGGLLKDAKAVAGQYPLLKGVPAAQYLCILVALALYGFGFEYLGAPLTGAAATVLLFAGLKVRHPLLYVLAVVFPLAVCWVFNHGLNVPLPQGDWW